MKNVKLIILFLVALLNATCERAQLDTWNGPTRHVAVVHSYDSLMQCYHEYDSVLLHDFKKSGLDVELKHYYLDRHYKQTSLDYYKEIFANIRHYNPELIITEGDKAFDIMLADKANSKWDTPLIGGGVQTPDWNVINSYSNVYVWWSKIDFDKVLLDIHRLTHKKLISTELDFTPHDSLLRKQLNEALEASLFINNVNLEDRTVLKTTLDENLNPDNITILSFSLEYPEHNVFKNDSVKGLASKNTRHIVGLINQFPHLMVKFNFYSLNATFMTDQPSFTVLPYRFGSPQSSLVTGYFVPMKAQAQDVCSTAVALLNNHTGIIRGGQHQVGAYMDYNLLPRLGLTYNDVKGDYIVVNIPNEVLHPFIGNTTLISILASLFLILILVLFGFNLYNMSNSHFLLHKIAPANLHMFSQQAVIMYIRHKQRAELYFFEKGEETRHIELNIKQLYEMIMSAGEVEYEKFVNATHTVGRYSFDLNISLHEGATPHWCRLRLVTIRTPFAHRLVSSGMLTQIDDEIKHKAEMLELQARVRDTERRENFINSMNHEIRTPLNVVLGCSQLLCSAESEYSSEERDQLIHNMTHASNQLMSIVQDILVYSRMGSGRMKYEIIPMQVEEIMGSLFTIYSRHFKHVPMFDENNVDKTGKLTLSYSPGTQGLYIMIDNECMQNIFGHLMSNAIKFTEKGDIRLGWNYHFSKDLVELYVEDSGIGIAKDKLDSLWRPFFKNNSSTSGVGLGLTLVHSMTEKMGGRVDVHSKLGLGSRFSLYFPARHIV